MKKKQKKEFNYSTELNWLRGQLQQDQQGLNFQRVAVKQLINDYAVIINNASIHQDLQNLLELLDMWQSVEDGDPSFMGSFSSDSDNIVLVGGDSSYDIPMVGIAYNPGNTGYRTWNIPSIVYKDGKFGIWAGFYEDYFDEDEQDETAEPVVLWADEFNSKESEYFIDSVVDNHRAWSGNRTDGNLEQLINHVPEFLEAFPKFQKHVQQSFLEWKEFYNKE